MKRRQRQPKATVAETTETLVSAFFDACIPEDELDFGVLTSQRIVGLTGFKDDGLKAKGMRISGNIKYTAQLSNTPALGAIEPVSLVTPEPTD